MSEGGSLVSALTPHSADVTIQRFNAPRRQSPNVVRKCGKCRSDPIRCISRWSPAWLWWFLRCSHHFNCWALGTSAVGIWARTVDKTADGWVQADRGGRPLQAVFLVGEQREAYLNGEPANDDHFISVFAHELEHSGGYSAEDAASVARKLLPDILSYNPREPVRYPDNGRTLTDDVVDHLFSIYTNRKVTDKVGPHRDLLDEFPYLGPPHDERVQRAL